MRSYPDVMRALRWIPNALTLLRGPIAVTILTLFVWDCAWRLPTSAAILMEWVDVTVVVPTAFQGLLGPEELFPFKLVALIITIVALVTDKLDGTLAKRFEHYGWKSEYGARVDPLMDKWMSYCGLGIVPLYYGIGPYLLLFVPLAWYIDTYSRETTRMRRRREILEANKYAQHKTAYLFAAQTAFIVAIAAEDLVRVDSVQSALKLLSLEGYADASGVEMFGYFAFGVALTTMSIAAGFCHVAMRTYRAQAQAARQKNVPAGLAVGRH
jgi:phosphatidylglycerophosphate synthase